MENGKWRMFNGYTPMLQISLAISNSPFSINYDEGGHLV